MNKKIGQLVVLYTVYICCILLDTGEILGKIDRECVRKAVVNDLNPRRHHVYKHACAVGGGTNS